MNVALEVVEYAHFEKSGIPFPYNDFFKSSFMPIDKLSLGQDEK